MVGVVAARVLGRVHHVKSDVSERVRESLRGLESGPREDGEHATARQILLYVLQQVNEFALGDVGGMRVGGNVQRHHVRLADSPLPRLTDSSNTTTQLQDTVCVGEFRDVRSTT